MGTQNVGRTWTGRVKVEMERIKTSSKSDSPTNSTRGKLKINDNYMSLRSFLLWNTVKVFFVLGCKFEGLTPTDAYSLESAPLVLINTQTNCFALREAPIRKQAPETLGYCSQIGVYLVDPLF